MHNLNKHRYHVLGGKEPQPNNLQLVMVLLSLFTVFEFYLISNLFGKVGTNEGFGGNAVGAEVASSLRRMSLMQGRRHSLLKLGFGAEAKPDRGFRGSCDGGCCCHCW